MKKTSILFVGLSHNIGGIENFVHNLYMNLDKNKYDISFLVDKNIEIAYYDIYNQDGCKFFKIENRKKNYIKYLHDLKNVFINNRFDIIHFNLMSYSLFERIMYASKYSDSKIIIHSHNGGYTKGYYKNRLLNNIGQFLLRKKKFNNVACGTDAGKYLFHNKEFKVIENGIDINKFSFIKANRDEIRKEFDIDDKTLLISLVAALLPVKNHKFLLDIFDEVIKINHNSKLLLVGEGPLKKKIQMKANKLNLDNKIIFAGKRNDAHKIYSASDVYVMPSFSEGLSMSICEAQINGLKCFTSTNIDKDSDISGNLEFISLDNNAKIWAERIISNHNRDYNVVSKIPEKIRIEVACKNMQLYYEELLSNNE